MSVNLITKSGGNALHGAGEYAFTNNNFESDNITDKLKAQGVKSAPKLSRARMAAASLAARSFRTSCGFSLTCVIGR